MDQHLQIGGTVQIAANGDQGFLAQLVFGHRHDNGRATAQRRQNFGVRGAEFIGIGRFDVDDANRAAARILQRNGDFGFHVVEKADVMRVGRNIARPVGLVINDNMARDATPRRSVAARALHVDALAPNLVRPTFAGRETQNQFARSHVYQRQKRARAADRLSGFFERGFENLVGFGQRKFAKVRRETRRS